MSYPGRPSRDMSDIVQGDAATPASKLEWSCMDEPSWKLDDYSLKPLPPPAHRTFESDTSELQDYTLAITGDVFRWILNHAPLETVQRVCTTIHITRLRVPDKVSPDAGQDTDLRPYVS